MSTLLNTSKTLDYKALLADLISLSLASKVEIITTILEEGTILAGRLLISNYLLLSRVIYIHFLLLQLDNCTS